MIKFTADGKWWMRDRGDDTCPMKLTPHEISWGFGVQDVPEPNEGAELRITSEFSVIKPARIPKKDGFYKTIDMDGEKDIVWVHDDRFYIHGMQESLSECDAEKEKRIFQGPINLSKIP